MPTPSCGNVIEWLQEILRGRGKDFGFGVGLVPLEVLEPDVDSMDVDSMDVDNVDRFSEDDDLESGGNSPGGDVPPREEPVPSPSLPPPSPVKQPREASARGTHWRKTKWEVCRSLAQLQNPFMITDAALHFSCHFSCQRKCCISYQERVSELGQTPANLPLGLPPVGSPS
jgi:hypothetical protein